MLRGRNEPDDYSADNYDSVEDEQLDEVRSTNGMAPDNENEMI